MAKFRKYVVTNGFKGFLPKTTDFTIVEEPIPELQNGEFLVKAEYISVDPYMRSFADSCRTPYEQFGFQVGHVIDSKNDELPKGTKVVSHSGWREYAVLNDEPDQMLQIRPYQANCDELPLSFALGSLGMPGVTAYLGLFEILKPKRGEIVCVTSAAGAVGSIVGQLAKLKGCTVIGFVGTDEKVKMLAEHLEFYYAFNYKSLKNIKDILKTISPDGLDCYFDNVGGELANKIMSCMKKNGRIAKCGSLSQYGKENVKDKTRIPTTMRVRDINYTDWTWPQQQDAMIHIKELLSKNEIKVNETIFNGFENLPQALVAMLKGENVGKTVVQI